MVSGCAQAPEAQVATDYLAGITSFDEVPVSEGATVRTSERGVVVEERFTREIDRESVRAREAQIRERVAEYREERDARDVLREDLASRGDAMVEVTFNMPETGLPDISRLSRENEVTRRNRIAERQLITGEAQEGYVAELREIGAGAISQFWLTNAISTELPAREALEFWARHPEASVSLNGTIRPEFDGVQVRSSTGPGVGRFVNAGLHGDPAGGPRYRIAIIEGTLNTQNWPSLQNHQAFRESAVDTTSRIQNVDDCNSCISGVPEICWSWGCAATADRSTSDGHGDKVAFLAIGSIEQGQDSTVSATTERVRRSGAAPEVVADYYGARDCDAIPRALQRAVERGSDVANMSMFRPEGGICNRGGNCSGINEAIRNATNAGLVLVKSAGNQGTAAGTTCTMTCPGWRPEVIAVGSLNGFSDDGLEPGSSTYAVAPRRDSSATGGVDFRYTIPLGTFTAPAAALGLMTWGTFRVEPIPGDTFSTGAFYNGTSFAAPIVSGTTALMAHSMSPDGVVYWPGQTITNMLLLGDASGSTGSVPVGLSNQFGFGRMRANTGAAMTAPWGWGSRTITGGTGVRTFTVSGSGRETGVREWRWVTASFENNLDALTTDYTIQVVDACPPGGGRLVIANDDSFDPRKRIQLNQAQICPTTTTCRCLEMEVLVHAAGSSGVVIHSSDFFHAGDPNVF